MAELLLLLLIVRYGVPAVVEALAKGVAAAGRQVATQVAGQAGQAWRSHSTAARKAGWRKRPVVRTSVAAAAAAGAAGKATYKALDRVNSEAIPWARRTIAEAWKEGAQRAREVHAERQKRKEAAWAESEDGRETLAKWMPSEAPDPLPEVEGFHDPEPEPTEDPSSSPEPEETQQKETDEMTQPNGQAPSPNGSGGAHGEAYNIESTRSALESIEKAGDQLGGLVDQLLGGLTAADAGPQTHGEVSEIFGAVDQVKAAARKAREGLNKRHGQLEEATNSAEHAAKREFYQH